jgi:hypothetical protein
MNTRPVTTHNIFSLEGLKKLSAYFVFGAIVFLSQDGSAIMILPLKIRLCDFGPPFLKTENKFVPAYVRWQQRCIIGHTKANLSFNRNCEFAPPFEFDCSLIMILTLFFQKRGKITIRLKGKFVLI